KEVKKVHPLYVMETSQNGKPCFEVSVPKHRIRRFFFTNADEDDRYDLAMEYYRSVIASPTTTRSPLRKDPAFRGPDMLYIQKKGPHGAIVVGPDGATKSFSDSDFSVQQNIAKA